MSLVTATPNILTDPGFLFIAPLNSTEPTHAVLTSTYDADAWPAAWINLGATEDGSEFSYETKVEPVSVAEFFDPIRYSTTERSGSIAFNMADVTLKNLSRALNSGIGTAAANPASITTVSGAAATLSSVFTPVAPGSEVRCMIGWESLDHTMRLVAYKCINGGSVKITNKKAPALATLAVNFQFEVPSNGIPFKLYAAGTVRLG